MLLRSTKKQNFSVLLPEIDIQKSVQLIILDFEI